MTVELRIPDRASRAPNPTAVTDGIRFDPPHHELRTAFRQRGYVAIADLWSPSVTHALAREARRLADRATVPTTGPRTPVAAERYTGRTTPVATGPALDSLHHGLTRQVRALSGQLLVPSFATYGYFFSDDGVILHLDTDATDIVVLTTAVGRTGPLLVHPDLQGRTVDDLGALGSDPEWDPRSGDELRYPANGAGVLRGAAIPHHRPALALDEVAVIAALHYRSPY
jgi:hypothetical protein